MAPLHDSKLFHNFIDFKKIFDRVWHEGFMVCNAEIKRGRGIRPNHRRAIQKLKEHSTTTRWECSFRQQQMFNVDK